MLSCQARGDENNVQQAQAPPKTLQFQLLKELRSCCGSLSPGGAKRGAYPQAHCNRIAGINTGLCRADKRPNRACLTARLVACPWLTDTYRLLEA